MGSCRANVTCFRHNRVNTYLSVGYYIDIYTFMGTACSRTVCRGDGVPGSGVSGVTSVYVATPLTRAIGSTLLNENFRGRRGFSG